MSESEIIVVYWEWQPPSKHAGARFWAAHAIENDGRLADWPAIGLKPIGAAKVTVTEGDGLDMLSAAAAPRAALAEPPHG